MTSPKLASPGGMLAAAAVLAALFGVAHALGLRSYTSILSGTVPPGASGVEAALLGLAYVALYFTFVIGVPILALAAAVMWLLTRMASRRGASPPAQAPVSDERRPEDGA